MNKLIENGELRMENEGNKDHYDFFTFVLNSPFSILNSFTMIFLLLTGCTLGPDFQRPKMVAPENWTGAAIATTTKTSQPTECLNLTEWWCAFNDAELDNLIQRGLQSNLDIQLAVQRIRQSRAVLGETAAGFWPALDTSGKYQRDYTYTPPPKTDAGMVSGSSQNTHTNLYQTGLDTSWELDIFGGVRRGVEATSADIRAAQENLNDVRVSLAAEIGTNYLGLRGFQEQLRITRENLDTQTRAAEITRKRYEAGFVSALDVNNAEAQTATTQAQIPSLEASIRQAIYQLSLLLGEPPEALVKELSPALPLPVIPLQIPAGLPSELLQRRPDIRSAEEQIHAATARIGVAKADLFPKFSLTGALSLQASDLVTWAKSVTRIFSFGEAVNWNLFKGGLTQATIEEKQAIAEQTLIQYRKTVLTALQEVESAWVAFDREVARGSLLETAVERNRKAMELSNALYVAGEGDFLSVLVAERSLYEAQAALSQSRSNAAKSLVSLYKALGGGWESDGADAKLFPPAMK